MDTDPHGDQWVARLRAQHEAAGANCPCGNGKGDTVPKAAVPSESEALDRIAALVENDKGTDDPKLRAIRHTLHQVGRLNKPDPKGPFLVLSTYAGFPQDPSAFDVRLVQTWREAQGRKRFDEHDDPGTLVVIRRADERSAGELFGMRLGKHEVSLVETGESSLN